MSADKKKAADESPFRIKVVKNGPYVVTGGVPLAEEEICVDAEGECNGWKQGKQYATKETYALCRCGSSKKMPYCDGSHLAAGFDGTETAPDSSYEEQAVECGGPALKLTDAKALCAKARFCHRAGGAWTLARQAEDPEAKQTAIEESCECPSGRLVAWDQNGAIEPDLEPSIGLVEDPQKKRMGPIWVKGGIQVESSDGRLYERRNRVTLCRCGKSLNKPFCDGRHLDQDLSGP